MGAVCDEIADDDFGLKVAPSGGARLDFHAGTVSPHVRCRWRRCAVAGERANGSIARETERPDKPARRFERIGCGSAATAGFAVDLDAACSASGTC